MSKANLFHFQPSASSPGTFLLLQAMTLTVAVLVIILTRVLKLKIPRKTKICSLHTSRIVLRLYEKCEKKIREDKQRS